MKCVEFAGHGLQAAALACGLLCSATPVLAAPPAKAAYTPPPMLTADDPAKVAAAKEFLVLFHPRTDPAYTAKMLDKVIPRMIAAEKEDNPKLDVKKFETENRAKMMATAADRLDKQAHVVSRHFTLQELKDLTAFCRSTLGRRLIEETPKIQGELLMGNRMAKAAAMKGNGAGSMMKMTVGKDGKATISPGAPSKK